MKRSFFPQKTACFAVWFALAAAFASNDGIDEFIPHGEAKGAMSLKGETWEETGPGYTVRLQLIDESERQAYLRRVTGTGTDPFATPPDKSPGFITFLLQIENSGGGDFTFQAQNCWLTTDRNEHLFPVGMEGLRATYGMLGKDLSPAYEKTGSAVLENSFTLRPDQSASGLLVYRSVKPKTRHLQVDLQMTASGGDVIRLHAPYRRPKKKSGKDQP